MADSDPIVLTWKAILDKKLIREDLEAGVTQISLPEGLKWFFDFYGPSILARACNPLLFDRMISLKKDRQINAKGILLTGSPGIGKSWFLMYAMYRLAAEPSVPEIILHSAKHFTAYWFRPDGTVSKIRSPVGDDLITVINKSTWYLYDANESENECFPIEAFTIVASSPNKRHYKGFMKQVGTIKLYMPPWTFDEILAAKVLNVSNHDDSVLVERYERTGGVPRLIYDAHLKYVNFLDNQKNQISNLTFENISDLCVSTTIPDDISDMLSHAIVKNELADDDGGMFGKVKISFISKHVAGAFFREKFGRQRAMILKAMKFALSWHPAVGGQTFEVGFNRLVELDERVRLRCVAVENGSEGEVVQLDVKNIVYLSCKKPESEANSVFLSESNYYIVPTSSQHAFIDSLLVTGNDVWCIQITVASRRSDFSDAKLNKYFRDYFAKVPNVRFLFVVPSQRHFEAPSIETKFYVAELEDLLSGSASSSLDPPSEGVVEPLRARVKKTAGRRGARPASS